ncbi:hypothetical protein A3A60_01170 [Candidatus Curtissbacteria bacterium RIFCSPLOWO2_01_FULL_42_26]|uniref:Uncharacterized protein n=1 Tax=Candidatus Curtissbacteria bacterium RIFCSPLOWO2_01_FULL_42_26 TaxID=1797729 RepID=A0A1F5HY95_9BACT|nr:MAG: hypothetical protein A3A60_01170 [Candidatus Curtissbacteria bacterium RIFCSPLOWO2_01_FULL_42_26]
MERGSEEIGFVGIEKNGRWSVCLTPEEDAERLVRKGRLTGDLLVTPYDENSGFISRTYEDVTIAIQDLRKLNDKSDIPDTTVEEELRPQEVKP